MVDVSDGLVTDLGRVAAASGVRVDLDGAVLRERYAAGPLTLALGEAGALHQVLSGGEEHSLVGVFADAGSLPDAGDAADADDAGTDGLGEPWHVVGRVLPRGGRRHPRHGRRRGAGRARLGPLRRLTVIRTSAFPHRCENLQVSTTTVPVRT